MPQTPNILPAGHLDVSPSVHFYNQLHIDDDLSTYSALKGDIRTKSHAAMKIMADMSDDTFAFESVVWLASVNWKMVRAASHRITIPLVQLCGWTLRAER